MTFKTDRDGNIYLPLKEKGSSRKEKGKDIGQYDFLPQRGERKQKLTCRSNRRRIINKNYLKKLDIENLY